MPEVRLLELKTIEIDVDVHRVIEAHRRNFSEGQNDILRRLLIPGESADNNRATRTANPVESPVSIGSRTTGNWSVEIEGTRYPARSLKEAYITSVVKLSDNIDGLMDKLAGLRFGSRRLVAKKPVDLYLNSPHLAEPKRKNCYEHDGWFIDLNLGRNQVATRIRNISREAGLRYGRDVAIKKDVELV